MTEATAFELVVITGMSGAGQTEATRSFEDIGYFVMDNLPPSVIEQVADLCRTSKVRRAAVVVRPSGREFFQEFFNELGSALTHLRDGGVKLRIVFLDASDETLQRRFEERRRPHPLAPTDRVQDGIERERALLGVLRDDAELVIDTSGLSPHELRRRIQEVFKLDSAETGLRVTVMSFGFKHGMPIDADMMFDVRFLPNPHWVPELRPLTGTEEPVREYVLSQPDAKTYLEHIRSMLEFLLPGFVREGKHYLTIAIGCTGGHHRSVALAEEIAKFVRELGYPCTLHHRDIQRR